MPQLQPPAVFQTTAKLLEEHLWWRGGEHVQKAITFLALLHPSRRRDAVTEGFSLSRKPLSRPYRATAPFQGGQERNLNYNFFPLLPCLRQRRNHHPVSSIQYPVSSIQYLVSSIQYLVSSIQYLVSGIQDLALYSFFYFLHCILYTTAPLPSKQRAAESDRRRAAKILNLCKHYISTKYDVEFCYTVYVTKRQPSVGRAGRRSWQ